jgi:hypothetical protein
MPWTHSEIESEWLGGERLSLPPDDVVAAFAVAEEVRGREWCLSTTMLPNGGRHCGFLPFHRVYFFGKRIQSLAGAIGRDALLDKLLQGDGASESELTAIYLLRSRRPAAELEIGPEVTVGGGQRRPDFRIRSGEDRWTYVEVTQLNQSKASDRTEAMLRRIADRISSIRTPFLLEIVLWREATEDEEDDFVQQACGACQAAHGTRLDVGDLASLLVKAGDAAAVIPSILPAADATRVALAKVIGGANEPHRQIMVRAPFADQRAEAVLTHEAKQLPKGESGLVMVDVRGQPTAFESWLELVPRRFTANQHTRVSGVLLFMFGTMLTAQGLQCLPFLKLIPNPHAQIPLAAWITGIVEEIRAETRRLTSYSD